MYFEVWRLKQHTTWYKGTKRKVLILVVLLLLNNLMGKEWGVYYKVNINLNNIFLYKVLNIIRGSPDEIGLNLDDCC